MITINVTELDSLWNKSIGLLHAKHKAPIYFDTRFGIHTFGMKFPIDVVICNDAMTVEKIVQELKPNRIFFWNPKYYHVIELPSGTIMKEHITIGTLIQLKFITT